MFNNIKLQVGAKNYQTKPIYETDNLVIGNVEYISSEIIKYGPLVLTSKDKYIFEKMDLNDRTIYIEVFSGLVVEEKTKFFDIPYITNLESLKKKKNINEEYIFNTVLSDIINEMNENKSKKMEQILSI